MALGVSEVSCDAPALFSRPAFEILGAVPDIGKGVMFYRALNTTSKLFLASGHLAIRIDEWPDNLFDWPMDFSEHSMPDVFIPDALPLKINKLDVACEPARRPPHADGASQQHSSMAAQLEVPHGQLPRATHGGADHGAQLCGDVDEAEDQGLHPRQLLPGSDGCDDVEDSHGSHGAEEQPDVLPQRSQQVPASKRSENLRSSRVQDPHLRPLRQSMAGEQGQGQVIDPLCAQSLTNGEDTAGPQDRQATFPKEHRDVFHRNIPGNFIRSMGKFFGWCTALTVALSECHDVQGQAGSKAIGKADSPRLGTAAADGGGGRRQHGQLGSSRTSPTTSGFSLLRPIPAEFQDPAGTKIYGSDGAASGGGADHRGARGAPMAHETTSAVPPGRRGGVPGRAGGGDRGRVLRGRAAAAAAVMQPNAHPLQGSADMPLTREDRGWMPLRSGLQKRLLGTIRSVRNALTTEARLYQQQAERARSLRRHGCDLVEIYGGFANITEEGLKQGLRVMQPVDKVHGISLETQADHQQLRQLLHRQKPFLSIWEIRCDPWSRIQHLNYDHDELEVLRDQHRLALREMAKTIVELYHEGCHFLLENPWGTEFWEQDELRPVLELPGVQLRKGSMCNFGLRGGHGQLLRKDTGWASDLEEILTEIAIPCPGNHEHELCLGSNAKRAQIYTKKLARAVVKGLLHALQQRGDERCLRHSEDYASWISSSTSWATSSTPTWSLWTSTTASTVWYVDISKDAEAWRPLLMEARERLQGKVQATATVKPDTAYHEQVQQLAPWKLKLVQIARAPKVRRLPLALMQKEAVTHRAAILLYESGHIHIESERVEDIKKNSGTRFDTPVSYALLLYGEAPSTSYDPDENKKPEQPSKPKMSASSAPDAADLEPEEQWMPHQPGAKDITFPGLHQGVPRWMLSVLMRVHVNLGHPGKEAVVRHLAQAGASGEALLAAKHLRCRVCERTKAPPMARPSKVFQARRFNDRLMLDLVFVRDVTSQMHTFLSQVDDGTTYHVMDLLNGRTSEEVAAALVKGWFKYFGYPDEMLLDAEGAMRGWDFEVLCAQAGVKVRFVPPDAHYQIGKAERHGQAAKHIMRRLVSQFAVTTPEEMQQVANMACFAKNTMARRSGASPCQ